MFKKLIFSLLFFEHEYLSNGRCYVLDIQNMSLKHANLVNLVSDFLFRAYFGFYDKKGKLLCYFFIIFF